MDKKQIQKEKDKEKAKIQLDTEIKAFSKSLNNKDQQVIKDTKKLVEDQSNGLIKGETTNLQLVYNFSVPMKNILPLNNMVKGTDIKQFSKLEKFTNAHIKKFTNVVMCFIMGKNPDTVISEDPYFYKVLRIISPSIIFQLKHNVIKHIDNNAFNNPIGRKPKQIYISMSLVNQKDDLKKKYNPNGDPFKYVSFETFNELANYFVLGKSNSEDSRSKLLKLLDPLYDYLVENKFLSKDIDNRSKECEKIHFVISDLFLLLDSESKLEDIANIKTFVEDHTNESGLVNFHKFLNSNNVKCVQAVRFENNKQTLINATTGESFLKQVSKK